MSSNPDDCRIVCYSTVGPKSASLPTQTLTYDAGTKEKSINGKRGSYTRQVLVKDAYVQEINVPAVYSTIKKKVVDTEAEEIEDVIPAQYKTITKKILKKEGGIAVWKQVDCASGSANSKSGNILPINYERGSAQITEYSKGIIDSKLYAYLIANPDVRVQLSSHTDSRGSAEANQTLSQQRAQSVVDYLVSKGISTDRLEAKGFGETMLKNKCADGVVCTEVQHKLNRRTEFSVIK